MHKLPLSSFPVEGNIITHTMYSSDPLLPPCARCLLLQGEADCNNDLQPFPPFWHAKKLNFGSPPQHLTKPFICMFKSKM